MARIVTVYVGDCRPFAPSDMSYVRWLEISAALAALGHEVDVATCEPGVLGRFSDSRPARRLGVGRRMRAVAMAPRLRRVPLAHVRWEHYDVVKTLFHIGFETLERHGGTEHPFVISKLGSVVDADDRPGVYFYGARRRQLFAVQERIADRSRFVSLLTEPSRARWERCVGRVGNTLLVPGAAGAIIPPPGPDPYRDDRRIRCLYAGNIYDGSQPEAHATLVAKLNDLGRRLATHGIRLWFLGPGDRGAIDSAHVTCVGAVPYERSWAYLHHADVGLVLALGPEPNENESTKIYHYLRVGLPTVCESGFPNEGLVSEAALGHVVANGDGAGLAAAVADAARATWDRQRAIEYILARHTWLHRAQIYHELLRGTGPVA